MWINTENKCSYLIFTNRTCNIQTLSLQIHLCTNVQIHLFSFMLQRHFCSQHHQQRKGIQGFFPALSLYLPQELKNQRTEAAFGDELMFSLVAPFSQTRVYKTTTLYEISSNINCWSQNFKEKQIFIAQFMFFSFFFPHTFTTTLSNSVPMSTLKTELYPLPAVATSITTSLLVLLAFFSFFFFFQCSCLFIVFPGVSHLHFPTWLYHSSLLYSATRTIIKMVWEMNYIYKNI